ncbi:hypothetical protein, partial [Bradyrhizobium sp.]|uniref:hypothetical protein n=1 Tax=Bradyrhizobium sp. TaxID=376 RepID=UPI003C41CAC3
MASEGERGAMEGPALSAVITLCSQVSRRTEVIDSDAGLPDGDEEAGTGAGYADMAASSAAVLP